MSLNRASLNTYHARHSRYRGLARGVSCQCINELEDERYEYSSLHLHTLTNEVSFEPGGVLIYETITSTSWYFASLPNESKLE